MKRLFYPRLAITNIKKNAKTYVPYLLTCIFTISLFYIIVSITHNPSLETVFGGGQLIFMLQFGISIVGIFACIFLFYTNSFLIKRRKKEIALYNILGMDKLHIMKMLSFETIISTIISLVVGIGSGMLLSKLVFLLLLNIVQIDTTLSFTISIDAIYTTCFLFCAIFIVTLAFNIFQIHISNPIELLSDSKNGEKEPKAKWLYTLLGILCLGAGYYLSVTISSPLEAFMLFFVAVILVIIGTYSLFVSGSITILKILKKKKKLYYQTKYFTTISGMIYRMKQNAVGLANICILSTCVIVILSTTISLYAGLEESLKTRYTHDMSIQIKNMTNTDSTTNQISTIIKEEQEKFNVKTKDTITYSFTEFLTTRNNDTFTFTDANESNYANAHLIMIQSIAQYNALHNSKVTLDNSEILYYQLKDDNTPASIVLDNQAYTIKQSIEKPTVLFEEQNLIKQCYFVLPNQAAIDAIITNAVTTSSYLYNFNIDTTKISDQDIQFMESVNTRVRSEISSSDSEMMVISEIRETSRVDFISTFGGLFFIGIFFGILFIMAVALIIYYKQISEGYEDATRYQIMQKVGMSKKEVKNSINFQVLLVFFLPLIMAGIHYAFAFPMVSKLLALFNLTNVSLFMMCSIATICVFALLYASVYYVTSKLYYKIVN